jgi:hypothetical protein
MPGLHHLDIWILHPDELTRWAWLFARLGWTTDAEWSGGATFVAGETYISVTTTPNTVDAAHDRRRPGVNHLAFAGGTPAQVDTLMSEAPAHGWRPLYADRYPHAGGPAHYAGWLENAAGFKVEIVAG